MSVDSGEDTLRVTAIGATLSGKGRLIWNRWVSRAPRLIVVDHTGEWRRHNVSASYVQGIGGLVDAFEANLHRRRWRIVANLNHEEVTELAALLLPEGDAWADSPIVPIGGAAVYLPEVDLSIDPHPYDRAKNFWRRGRHVKLSVFADTQSPSSTSKEVLKNSEIVAVLSLHYPVDLAVVEGMCTSKDEYQRVRAWIRKPYHSALIMPQIGQVSYQPPGPSKMAP